MHIDLLNIMQAMVLLQNKLSKFACYMLKTKGCALENTPNIACMRDDLSNIIHVMLESFCRWLDSSYGYIVCTAFMCVDG